MTFESNGIAYELRDISFLSAETLDMQNDCLLLRVNMRRTTAGQVELPIPVDALIKLDIGSYIHHLDAAHTINVVNQDIEDENPLHKTYKDYLDWVRSGGEEHQESETLCSETRV